MMHRELARLRSYQGEFSTIVHETAGAFDTVITAAHDSTANLGRLANVLSTKIDQAHEAIAALDARSGLNPVGDRERCRYEQAGAQGRDRPAHDGDDRNVAALRERKYQEAIPNGAILRL